MLSPIIKNTLSKHREAKRRQIVYLVYVVYFLLIFEGALRKWFFPEYHKIIFFIRDPFVVVIYAVAYNNNLLLRLRPYYLFLFLGFVFIFMIPVFLVFHNPSVIMLLYGWRNYFFYVPLAFIIGRCFNAEDLNKLVKYTLFCAIPMAVLVMIQFRSSPDSFINKQIDEGTVFQVIHGVVRTTGTFTFTAGQTMFVGSVIAFLFTVWLLPKKHPLLGQLSLYMATAAGITMWLLSGSRTAFFIVALEIMTILLLATIVKTHKIKTLLLPIVFIAVSAWAFVTVFSDSFDAMTQRQEGAVRSEGSTIARAFRMFTDVLSAIPEADIIGYGLGTASNAASEYANSKFVFLEDPWSMNVLEGGLILGLLYVFLRIYLFFYMLILSLRAAKRQRNPLAILIFSFIGIFILMGTITSQGTMHGYAWLFAGFCLAASRMSLGQGTSVRA